MKLCSVCEKDLKAEALLCMPGIKGEVFIDIFGLRCKLELELIFLENYSKHCSISRKLLEF